MNDVIQTSSGHELRYDVLSVWMDTRTHEQYNIWMTQTA